MLFECSLEWCSTRRRSTVGSVCLWMGDEWRAPFSLTFLVFALLPLARHTHTHSLSLSLSLSSGRSSLFYDRALFQYEPKANRVSVDCEGDGGYEEFLNNLSESKVQFGLLRVEDGDRESRRVKFVFVTWCGPATGGIVKARSNTHKRDVARVVGVGSSRTHCLSPLHALIFAFAHT
jgi:Cofilin/tropomyosin-type actin-binding protein